MFKITEVEMLLKKEQKQRKVLTDENTKIKKDMTDILRKENSQKGLEKTI